MTAECDLTKSFIVCSLFIEREAEETRDVHVEDGEKSFKMFIGFNFKQLL
jgi:hypothetical protein